MAVCVCRALLVALLRKVCFAKYVAHQVKFISAEHWRTFYQVFNTIE